ncbi:beta-hexosaminidase [Pedobacter sp. HMWF019]|uniref:family 20 glycosylhydrolase n=1 Tax=Pedobacter sp. HMWF019 TaxID=2056856 RepID=UPI000D3574F0|nr:family 20 glycosylhydrolase [Pedobacter sp. HMWF019]PTT02173.1 beta-hexosaminidase [Pedobacter sp. HMWF019]
MFNQRIIFFLTIIAIGFASLKNACAQQENNRYLVIPYPSTLEPGKGIFIVSRHTAIVAPAKMFKNERAFLQKMLAGYLGIELPQKNIAKGKNTIVMKYDAQIKADEGYRLMINPGQVILQARTPTGMFYAMETLRQLLPEDVERGKGKTLVLSSVKIADQPKFAWRAMMLDVSRHFFSLQYLKKYVDMMALYKMNKLHLHLTDDQGWRIEIKKYPELTRKSAWREFNNQDTACVNVEKATGNTDFRMDKQHLLNRDGKIMYGGFYTQEQMTSFIRYAQSRHVEIIPEIDMPGHMMAAVKAYNYLTCDGTVGNGPGFSNPICPCNPRVLQFAKDVYSEIADLFPSKYLHIGGDEVEKSNWEKSPFCQAFMREMGFTHLNQIQHYFTAQMKTFFGSKGKILVGWDEISEAGIDSDAVVMFWRSWAESIPLQASKNKNKIIMSPSGPLYFDAVPDINTLADVYNYNPLSKKYGLSKTQEKNITGVQGNLWTEMIPTEERADYMIMPRMTALAEVGWTYRPLYGSYIKRLEKHYKRLDDLNINYRMPDITGLVENNVFVGEKLFFKEAPLKYYKIRYTTDGSLPEAGSKVLDKPLSVKHNLSLKIALFTPSGRRGDISTLHFAGQQYKKTEPLTNLQYGLHTALYKGSFSRTTKIKSRADSTFMALKVEVPVGIKYNEFGLRFNGYIDVPETGIYSFYLNCDDGGVLYIGDQLLIDNDGLHPAKEKGGQVALEKGLHTFKLNFIDGGGGSRLDFKYSIGNSEQQLVPASWFKHKE